MTLRFYIIQRIEDNEAEARYARSQQRAYYLHNDTDRTNWWGQEARRYEHAAKELRKVLTRMDRDNPPAAPDIAEENPEPGSEWVTEEESRAVLVNRLWGRGGVNHPDHAVSAYLGPHSWKGMNGHLYLVQGDRSPREVKFFVARSPVFPSRIVTHRVSPYLPRPRPLEPVEVLALAYWQRP